VRLTWSVWGDDIIERELVRFSGRLAADPTPAYAAIVADMMESIEKNFDTEGKHASGGWPELAESTRLQKDAAGWSPGTILRATNDLFNSLTQEGDENMVLILGEGLTFGSSVPYGGFHQQGTRKMPMRKPLEFPEVEKVGWMKQLQRYIVTGNLGPGAVT